MESDVGCEAVEFRFTVLAKRLGGAGGGIGMNEWLLSYEGKEEGTEEIEAYLSLLLYYLFIRLFARDQVNRRRRCICRNRCLLNLEWRRIIFSVL